MNPLSQHSYSMRCKRSQFVARAFLVPLLVVAVLCSASLTHASEVRTLLSPSLKHVMYAQEGHPLAPGFAPASPTTSPLKDRSHKKNRSISLEEAFSLAEKNYGGRALSGKLEDAEDHKRYKIKVLSDSGRVSVVFVNKESGSVYKAH